MPNRPSWRFPVSSLPIIDDLSGFAPTAILIGEGQRADLIWTKGEFLTLCHYLLNGNGPTDFLQVYRDAEGSPKFVKSKRACMDRRATWSWDTIRGQTKSKVGIGFYPTNPEGQSRWGAMDFDGHDGDCARPRHLAIATLQLFRRQPQFYLILATSGSRGWHLFVLTDEFYPISQWTLLLKQAAAAIGAEIRSGHCEIFPNEVHGTARPYGIRAPGTWNPKTNQLGAIVFTSIAPPLLQKIEKKEESPFLYHSPTEAKTVQLNDNKSFYSGQEADWQKQFAIIQPSTRHSQLKKLVHHIFRQVGHGVARANADAQYQAARVQPKAILAEHLEEFEQLWSWTTEQWRAELSDAEREIFACLGSEIERDLFRILKSFADYAHCQRIKDFPFPVQYVAERLGVSFQYVSKLRRRFVDRSIIAQTEPAITNRSAARFRWCL